MIIHLTVGSPHCRSTLTHPLVIPALHPPTRPLRRRPQHSARLHSISSVVGTKRRCRQAAMWSGTWRIVGRGFSSWRGRFTGRAQSAATVTGATATLSSLREDSMAVVTWAAATLVGREGGRGRAGDSDVCRYVGTRRSQYFVFN